MRILMIGPSSMRAKGGMATVIKEIQEDSKLNEQYEIDYFSSFIDGNILVRIIYSITSFIRFIVSKRNYDVYHIHLASRGSTFRKGYYIRAAKRWGKKVIAHIHGAQYMEFYDEITEKKKAKVREILNSADIVVALSENWKKKFENTFNLNNCEVIENGINVEKYRSNKQFNTDMLKSFVCLGRLGKRKGTYDIITAVSQIKNEYPDIKVYLAGDGEIEQAKEETKKNDLENNIIIVGWVDEYGKIELLDKVATVILPSYNEGLPMSILEGMAAGKAIVSTKVGAIPEVIGEDNGVLINPGDTNALSSALGFLYNNRELIRRYSRINIDYIEKKYSTKIMHKKIARLYDKLCS